MVGWAPYSLPYLALFSWVGSGATYADPAQPLTTAGEELDYLDRDLSDLSVRGVESYQDYVVGMNVQRYENHGPARMHALRLETQ